jgi:hypothetical protein
MNFFKKYIKQNVYLNLFATGRYLEGTAIQPHTVLTSILTEKVVDVTPFLYPRGKNPGTDLIGGSSCPTADWGVLKKK